MNTQQVETFNVIGIAIRTSNENGQSAQDIPALWNKFLSEGVLAKIPNKTDNTIYCMYTDYEKDHTKPYTTLLGCRVSSLETIPEGMTGKTITKAGYAKHTVKGDLLQGIVFNEWVKIWNSGLDRTFVADFEVYGEKAQDRSNAEVDIFVAVK